VRRHVLLSDEEPLVWIDEPESIAERIEVWLLRHPRAARRAQDAVLVAGIWGVLIAAWWAGSAGL
jgi:hypothetical protein